MSLISLTDYRPMPRYDGNSWTGAKIDGAVAVEGPWSTIATVSFEEPDTDPAKPIERSFTISVEDSDTTWLRVVFVDDQGQQDVANPVSTTAETIELASIPDVAKRLGRFLTDDEEVQVNALIVMATNNIYAAVDKPSTWVPSADVRDFLSGLCIELVVRSMMNPHGLASQSETLGQHSVTQQFSRDSRDNAAGSKIALNAAEELAARRIVYGSNSGSAHARSVIGVADDCYYADDIITTTPPTNGSTGATGPMGPAGPAGPAGQSAPSSLLRAYGPPTATPIPATTWTVIPLTGTWDQRDQASFAPVTSGPYTGAALCQQAGVYALAGAVAFDPSNQSGQRGVWVTDPQTADTWDLIDSGTAAKGTPAPMIVNGEVYLDVGDMISLQAWSSVATQTTTNPNSEWLSATRVS